MIELVLVTAAAMAAVLLAAELLIRALGHGAFPLFEASPQGRYRMKPNQSGRFMRRHYWRYDANGMRNERAPESFEGTTVLVGDSVVDGGLRFGQHETLGARMSELLGEDVYTVAAPAWALANSLEALEAIGGWPRAKRLVYVINSGDFDDIIEMKSEFRMRTRHPRWLTGWMVKQKAYRSFPPYRRFVDARNGVSERRFDKAWRPVNLAGFQRLLDAFPGPVLLVRYPLLGEDVRDETYLEELASLAPRIRIIEGEDAPGWSEACYSDHIHPNADGLRVLARHICEGLG